MYVSNVFWIFLAASCLIWPAAESQISCGPLTVETHLGFCSLNCATSYSNCPIKPPGCDFCYIFLSRFFLLDRTRDFLLQVQQIEDNLTELPMDLNSEEIDKLIENLNIDPERLEAMANQKSTDNITEIVQQALQESLESLLNDFFSNDRQDLSDSFGKLRSNIEHIKNDFEFKMYLLGQKFKKNQQNITELATLESESKALESKTNLLDHLATKVNSIEENMQAVGLFVKSFHNYTMMLEEFDSRLKILETMAQSTDQDKISKLIDEKIKKILEKPSEELAKKGDDEQPPQKNIADIVNNLSSKLLEVEAKLASFQQNFKIGTDAKSQMNKENEKQAPISQEKIVNDSSLNEPQDNKKPNANGTLIRNETDDTDNSVSNEKANQTKIAKENAEEKQKSQEANEPESKVNNATGSNGQDLTVKEPSENKQLSETATNSSIPITNSETIRDEMKSEEKEKVDSKIILRESTGQNETEKAKPSNSTSQIPEKSESIGSKSNEEYSEAQSNKDHNNTRYMALDQANNTKNNTKTTEQAINKNNVHSESINDKLADNSTSKQDKYDEIKSENPKETSDQTAEKSTASELENIGKTGDSAINAEKDPNDSRNATETSQKDKDLVIDTGTSKENEKQVGSEDHKDDGNPNSGSSEKGSADVKTNDGLRKDDTSTKVDEKQVQKAVQNDSKPQENSKENELISKLDVSKNASNISMSVDANGEVVNNDLKSSKTEKQEKETEQVESIDKMNSTDDSNLIVLEDAAHNETNVSKRGDEKSTVNEDSKNNSISSSSLDEKTIPNSTNKTAETTVENKNVTKSKTKKDSSNGESLEAVSSNDEKISTKELNEDSIQKDSNKKGEVQIQSTSNNPSEPKEINPGIDTISSSSNSSQLANQTLDSIHETKATKEEKEEATLTKESSTTEHITPRIVELNKTSEVANETGLIEKNLEMTKITNITKLTETSQLNNSNVNHVEPTVDVKQSNRGRSRAWTMQDRFFLSLLNKNATVMRKCRSLELRKLRVVTTLKLEEMKALEKPENVKKLEDPFQNMPVESPTTLNHTIHKTTHNANENSSYNANVTETISTGAQIEEKKVSNDIKIESGNSTTNLTNTTMSIAEEKVENKSSEANAKGEEKHLTIDDEKIINNSTSPDAKESNKTMKEQLVKMENMKANQQDNPKDNPKIDKTEQAKSVEDKLVSKDGAKTDSKGSKDKNQPNTSVNSDSLPKPIPPEENKSKPKPKPANCNTKLQSDCYDYYKQGYMKNSALGVRPKTTSTCDLVKVSCDMRSGGFTIIMRRTDGQVDFYRNWEEYKSGFGDVNNEHWIGNDMIYYLTNQANYSLKIELEDWSGVKKFAMYESFRVKSEEEGYELQISGYSGNTGDSLTQHNGKKFSTFDVDNDDAPVEFWNGNCAKRFHGAWWYKACYRSNLNGLYYNDTNGQVADKKNDGLAWNSWHGHKYSLKSVEMKLKRNFNLKKP